MSREKNSMDVQILFVLPLKQISLKICNCEKLNNSEEIVTFPLRQ